MGKHEKLLLQIIQGRSDRNTGFEELRKLLLQLGFKERIRGSHHVFRKTGVEEMINLQKDGNKAKPYQVRQVRAVLLRYRPGDQGNV